MKPEEIGAYVHLGVGVLILAFYAVVDLRAKRPVGGGLRAEPGLFLVLGALLVCAWPLVVPGMVYDWWLDR